MGKFKNTTESDIDCTSGFVVGAGAEIDIPGYVEKHPYVQRKIAKKELVTVVAKKAAPKTKAEEPTADKED